MRLLLIGGGGYLGGIVCPALEAEHKCRYLDIRPVPDAEDRTIVADVNDDEAMHRAVQDIDVLVYMALGAGEPRSPLGSERKASKYHNPEAAMNVNVLGLYRALQHGVSAGVRRFVHSSSLSVYEHAGRPFPVDESRPMDARTTYGLSKRLAEVVCQATIDRCPEASIVALRLMLPYTQEQFTAFQNQEKKAIYSHPLGPRDAQRLYLAAVQFDRPGLYPIQASGDVAGSDILHHRAQELLGWTPRGE